MNESKFSSLISAQFNRFRVLSLERLPTVGVPDLLLTSIKYAPMCVMVELKTQTTMNKSVSWEPSQPRIIANSHAIGSLVGTLILVEGSGELVWVKPEATVKAYRERTPLGKLVLGEGASVIAHFSKEPWSLRVQDFLEGVVEGRLRVLKSN